MIDSKALLADLQKEVTKIQGDLRTRCDEEPAVNAPLQAQYESARVGSRTALTFKAWREEELTNVAVAWVLACVFVRFLEDNGLVETLHLAGPDSSGLARAWDQQIVYFRERPELTEREYLEHVFREIGTLPGMADLLDRRHNPLWTVGPSGDAARAFIEFWRKADAGTGRPVHDFTDPDWNTRFLGDLYQDLSEAARKRYALLQTPVFIEQFILDRTLTPAIETFGFREVRMIDPTCGSGHFLLGGFARLHALWSESQPDAVPSAIAQRALDQVFGVDLNPNVVAIARFRLLLAALRVCGVRWLRDAYDFKIHVAAGDALLHGRRFREFETNTGPQRTFDTEEAFRDELRHHYEVEDVEALHRILGRQYHAVVGNPPYITVKDRAVSELYRARFPSCYRVYSLSVPFLERFFDLAVKGDGTSRQAAGFIGQITANSFMKREFGRQLIEKFVPRWDLTHIIDTSGAYIPGHGTPTVILLGRNQLPVKSTIRTVFGIRGEPPTPSDPSQGFVWNSICLQIDQPGSKGEWVSVADSARASFQKHPWSIGGGGLNELKEALDEAALMRVGDLVSAIGRTVSTQGDEVFVQPTDARHRLRLSSESLREFVIGEDVRGWTVTPNQLVVFPYDSALRVIAENKADPVQRFLWPARAVLGGTFMFGNKTKVQTGMNWYEYGQFIPERLKSAPTITFAFVSTHNNFAIDRGGRVFNRSAPVIKLQPAATDSDYTRAIGIFNSSTACFWMKQVFHSKGGQGVNEGAKAELWERFTEFDGTKLRLLPIPAHQPLELPTALLKYSAAMMTHTPATTLGNWDSLDSLRMRLAEARNLYASQRRKLIAWQEELDWQTYEAFALVEPADRVSLPENESIDAIPPDGIQLGQRAFEIVLARRMETGEAQTTWFERHGSTPITELPRHWSGEYRELVERRIRRIEADPNICLIEQPEYKRRWNTESWDEQFQNAARDWLLARLEGYFHEGQRVCELKDGFVPAAAGFAPATRPALTTTNQLADVARADAAFLAVAEELMGGPGYSAPKLVRELVESAAVPSLPSNRYKPSGLLKRRDWEQVWDLQRREDAIDAAERVDEPDIPEAERARRKTAAAALKKAEVGDIPVPPKYASADFKKTVWWSLRGKLDVPKERWISYPGTERPEDPSPVIAWAGWDHAQQAQALAEYFVEARDNWTASSDKPAKLKSILASLEELMPWLRQWHSAIDPTFGASPADSIAGFLDAECNSLGLTRADLHRVRLG